MTNKHPGGTISGSTIYRFAEDGQSVTFENVHTHETMTMPIWEAYSFAEEFQKRIRKVVTYEVDSSMYKAPEPDTSDGAK
jgi:hypothetical protein